MARFEYIKNNTEQKLTTALDAFISDHKTSMRHQSLKKDWQSHILHICCCCFCCCFMANQNLKGGNFKINKLEMDQTLL